MYKLRVQEPGAYYHFCARGNNKCEIFRDPYDRLVFLIQLTRAASRYGWSIVAYCLMTNHYHLVMQIGEAGMSQGFCELNGGYARAFNIRHGRINHLFGRRYWDALIEDDSHLLESIRYTVLNPVRAGLSTRASDWEWSSYRACAGIDHPLPLLAVDHALDLFHCPNALAARSQFRRFVREGLDQRQPPSTKCHASAR
jgi:putative transposase